MNQCRYCLVPLEDGEDEVCSDCEKEMDDDF